MKAPQSSQICLGRLPKIRQVLGPRLPNQGVEATIPAMQQKFGMRRGWSAGFVLALLALLVRAAVPTGFMVAIDKGPHLVVCTGHTVSPSNPGPSPHHDQQKPDAPCAFAAAHVAIAGPDLSPSPPRTELATETLTLRAPDLAPGRGLAAPPPPSTGPPIRL